MAASICLMMLLPFAQGAYASQEADVRTAQRCPRPDLQDGQGKGPAAGSDFASARPSVRNHYSEALGQCYQVREVTHLQRSPAMHRILLRDEVQLWDAGGDEPLGRFDAWQGNPPMVCKVGSARCTSREEWNRLAQPYLEN